MKHRLGKKIIVFALGLPAVLVQCGCNEPTQTTNQPPPASQPAPPPKPETSPFLSLFPEDGVPAGWVVRSWEDLQKPVAEGVTWKVENGVLQGSAERGNWLVSEKEYGDFILEFEWKLGERGNSGFGFRFPLQGDPSFEGLELQMVDPRYYRNGTAPAQELTGSLYKALAPRVQLFKPVDWNKYEVTCKGPLIKVVLNGETVLDVNLDEQQLVEITRLAAESTRAADPTAFRVVNSCCTWGEYVATRRSYSGPLNRAARTPLEYVQAVEEARVP